MPFPALTEWVVQNLFALIPVKKIQEYERGVKFRRGKAIATKKHGIYLYVPFYESIEVVDIQQQTHNLLSQSATTQDLTSVTFSCNLTYRVKNARKMFTVVHDFDNSLQSLVMMIVFDEASAADFNTLVLERRDVEARCLERINERVKEWGAVVDEFAFTDLTQAKPYRFFGDPPGI